MADASTATGQPQPGKPGNNRFQKRIDQLMKQKGIAERQRSELQRANSELRSLCLHQDQLLTKYKKALRKAKGTNNEQ